KFLLGWLEKREVRFVIDDYNIRRRFFARLRAFELNVILIRHEIGRDEDAALRQNRAERALREWRLLLPRPHVIVRLPGDVHAHERKLFRLNDRLGTFLCRRESAQRQNQNESEDE